MTPVQAQVLTIIKELNGSDFDGWFEPSEVMAFVQIESGFRAKAYRYEPRLGEGSYGLMQVLASTARTTTGLGNPESMYVPRIGLEQGMKVARGNWEGLKALLAREPTYEEWAVAYNAGLAGDVRHIKRGDTDFDAAYANAWDTAQEFWAAQGVDV